MKLELETVEGTTRCWCQEDASVMVWSSYDVTFRSPSLRSVSGSVTMQLLHAVGASPSVVFAECTLSADTTRRDLRSGTLVVGDSGRASLFSTLFSGMPVGAVDTEFFIRIVNGSNVLAFQQIPVMWTVVPMGSGGGSSASSASMWSVVSGGTVPSGGSVNLEDRSQTTFTATSYVGDINIVPVRSGVPISTGSPFEAYAVFTVGGTWDPIGSVKVNGSAVVWDYEDSKLLESDLWTVHLQSVSGTWHGTLRANDSAAPGTEEDSDSDLMPGAGVN